MKNNTAEAIIELPRAEYGSVPLAGAKLEYRSIGTGEPVLLLHGIPGDLETLAPAADELARGYRATTLSMRHCGPPPHGTRPFGTQQQYDDLFEFIQTRGGAPIHIVAWSYAAHAALALAARAPQVVRSLLVYEPGFPTFVNDTEVAAQIAMDTRTAFASVFEALAVGDAAEAVRRSIDAAAGSEGWYDRQPEKVRAVHRRCAHQLSLLATQTPPIALHATELQSIRLPVTVAYGSASRPCYTLTSAQAFHLIPDARLVVLDGATHLLPETEQICFADLLNTHLRQARLHTKNDG
ncbi:MAG: alpha/beta hydrolase [Pseudomonadota bacterium]